MTVAEEQMLVEKFLVFYGKILRQIYPKIEIKHDSYRDNIYNFSMPMQGFFGEKLVSISRIILNFDEENNIPRTEITFSDHFDEKHHYIIKEFLGDFVDKNPGLRIDVDWEKRRL